MALKYGAEAKIPSFVHVFQFTIYLISNAINVRGKSVCDWSNDFFGHYVTQQAPARNLFCSALPRLFRFC